ncbi:unnamed protein product [Pedinophyceae sp. YPF-701]|nr:unnamed protein product [Pedinophyceae sp. YPF-701]
MTQSGFSDWYNGLPPFSRALGTAWVVTGTAVRFGMLSPVLLIMDWGWVLGSAPAAIAGKYGKYQLWRLLTNFMFVDKLSMGFFFNMLFLHSYAVPLERVVFEHSPADFLALVLFAVACILALQFALPLLLGTALYLGAHPLLTVFVYVWSRENAAQTVRFWGMISFQAFYLPFVLVAFTLIQGGSPVPDLAGIGVGHLYWFITKLYPAANGGRQLLTTPLWVHKLANAVGMQDGVPRPAPARPTAGARPAGGGMGAPRPEPAAATATGFRAFTGTRRRLAD